jgi:hypothetical protein
MPDTPFVIRSDGAFKTTKRLGRYKKELLREGEYQHPTNPWPRPLRVDAAYLELVARNTKAGLDAGVKVPLPITHIDAENPEANRGFWDDVEVEEREDGSKTLYGYVDVTDPDTDKRIGRELQDVSVYLDDWGSGTWKPEGDRLVHVALTQYPVASGHDNFVALSVGNSVDSKEVPVLRREAAADERKNTMKLSAQLREAAKALGVTLAGDELDEEGLKAIFLAAEPAETPPAPTADDVPRLLSVDVEKERYFARAYAAEEKNAEGVVKAATDAGKLTADMAEAAKALLAVRHGYSLSADGKVEAVDVHDLVTKLLSAIPDKAVVPVEDKVNDKDLKNSAAAAPPVKPKEFGAKDAEEEAKQILATTRTGR